MARMRIVKPRFFTDEEIGELPPLTRLLFIGLWCFADRRGRLEDRPKRIKTEILPYDNHNIDTALTTLHDAGFITRFSVDAKKFIQINNFEKHQHCHVKEPESTIPAPCKTGANPSLTGTGTGTGTEHIDAGASQQLKSPKKPKLTDDEWLVMIKANPAYQVFDVDKLRAKMEAWCITHEKKPTRRRLLGWLNREERPLDNRVDKKETVPEYKRRPE